jgi:lysophospholipase
MNNFTTIDSLRSNPRIWNFKYPMFLPFGLDNIGASFRFWSDILSQVADKASSGFAISIVDLWSRALSYQFLDYPRGAPGLQFSDLTNWRWFQDAQAPFPIIVYNVRSPLSEIASPLASIVEASPFEMGVFDKKINGFISEEYLGTGVANGVAVHKCYTGFDNAGFVMGTSSSIFDAGLKIALGSSLIPSFLRPWFNTFLDSFTLDVARYKPNPFYQWWPAKDINVRDSDSLYCVDGGVNGEPTPVEPLLLSDRAIDVAFLVDVSQDTHYQYPNGTSLVKSYEHQFRPTKPNRFVSVPYIPDATTFINEGLTDKPTFAMREI